MQLPLNGLVRVKFPFQVCERASALSRRKARGSNSGVGPTSGAEQLIAKTRDIHTLKI
jgi:hypothetical protein